ncbi:hypothetical protein BS78_03G255300 [Paspalum vaginatum]|nr:hypothetical protein BS78_03G255300 [Paspalum vaginatum]
MVWDKYIGLQPSRANGVVPRRWAGGVWRGGWAGCDWAVGMRHARHNRSQAQRLVTRGFVATPNFDDFFLFPLLTGKRFWICFLVYFDTKFKL